MEFINDLIISINEAGLRTSAYATINTIANYCAILFGFIHARKLKVGIIPSGLTVLAERELSGYLMTAIIFIENGFTDTGKLNAPVVYPYIPLMGFLVSKIVRRSYKEIWDIMIVPPMVMFIGARIACTVAGCCRGYPCSWGIYNVKIGECVFPIQLLESIVTIIILLFVIRRERKNNFVPDGRNVPIILISYGVSRFFLEFLHDNEKIIAGLASTQFHCLIMIISGVITLMIIRRSEQNQVRSIMEV